MCVSLPLYLKTFPDFCEKNLLKNPTPEATIGFFTISSLLYLLPSPSLSLSNITYCLLLVSFPMFSRNATSALSPASSHSLSSLILLFGLTKNDNNKKETVKENKRFA
jgi:hypothetical protein